MCIRRNTYEKVSGDKCRPSKMKSRLSFNAADRTNENNRDHPAIRILNVLVKAETLDFIVK